MECEKCFRLPFEVQARESRGCSLLTSAFDVDSKAQQGHQKRILTTKIQVQATKGEAFLCDFSVGCKCQMNICDAVCCISLSYLYSFQKLCHKLKIKRPGCDWKLSNQLFLHTPSPPHLLLLSSLNCGIYDPDCSGTFSDSIHPWSKAHCWFDGSLDWRQKSISAKQRYY